MRALTALALVIGGSLMMLAGISLIQPSSLPVVGGIVLVVVGSLIYAYAALAIIKPKPGIPAPFEGRMNPPAA